MRQNWAYLLIIGALAFGLVACGGSNDGGSGGKDNGGGSSNTGSVTETQPSASQEIVIKASNWEFDKKEYDIPKDTPVKITLELEGGHGMKVDGTDINLGPGHTSTVVTLKEGTYDFKCSIICGRGHNDMKSKLVVK